MYLNENVYIKYLEQGLTCSRPQGIVTINIILRKYGLPCELDSKNAMAGDPGSIPRSKRSPGGKGWQPPVLYLEGIPWNPEEPGELQSMGLPSRKQ